MRFHFGVGAVFSSFAESKVNVRKITFTRNNCFVTPTNRCAKLSPSSGTALIQAKPKMGGLISGSALAVVLWWRQSTKLRSELICISWIKAALWSKTLNLRFHFYVQDTVNVKRMFSSFICRAFQFSLCAPCELSIAVKVRCWWPYDAPVCFINVRTPSALISTHLCPYHVAAESKSLQMCNHI